MTPYGIIGTLTQLPVEINYVIVLRSFRFLLPIKNQQSAARKRQDAADGKKALGANDIKEIAIDKKAQHNAQPVGNGIVDRLAQGFGFTGGQLVNVEDAGHMKGTIGEGMQKLGQNDQHRRGCQKQNQPAETCGSKGQDQNSLIGEAPENPFGVNHHEDFGN